MYCSTATFCHACIRNFQQVAWKRKISSGGKRVGDKTTVQKPEMESICEEKGRIYSTIYHAHNNFHLKLHAHIAVLSI